MSLSIKYVPPGSLGECGSCIEGKHTACSASSAMGLLKEQSHQSKTLEISTKAVFDSTACSLHLISTSGFTGERGRAQRPPTYERVGTVGCCDEVGFLQK